MNTKNNQRTRISKLMFHNAIMELLKEKKSIDRISIKELCDRAELNRSTFYAHYDKPEDLLEEIENEIIEATDEHLKKIGEGNNIGAHKYILSFLNFIKKNDNSFRTLLAENADPTFKNRFMQRSIMQIVANLDVNLPENTEQYVYSYILNGSAGIIIQWIRSDYSADENEIVDLLFNINNSALTNIAF